MSEIVKSWQRAIGVKPDGWFGPESYRISMALLRSAPTVAPAVTPPAPSTFIGTAKRLDALDLPRIGARIGIGEDELRAVIEVETAGGGFDTTGRPRMLFEPHVFYRLLPSAQQRDRAESEGLAYAKWGHQPYPRESYTRLHLAIAIDRVAALKSASWGLGQIMGFNFALAGFDHVEAMVSAFMADEETHVEAMIAFIRAKGLDDKLRAHDWAGFALGYNGAAYASHGYHTKLAAAFARWRGIPDTPIT